MNTITLQVPIDPAIRASAQKAANNMGFSSLQDAVRLFLANLAAGRLSAGFTETFPDEVLTPTQEKVLAEKYAEAMREYKTGKLSSARTVEEFMAQVRAGR